MHCTFDLPSLSIASWSVRNDRAFLTVLDDSCRRILHLAETKHHRTIHSRCRCRPVASAGRNGSWTSCSIVLPVAWRHVAIPGCREPRMHVERQHLLLPDCAQRKQVGERPGLAMSEFWECGSKDWMFPARPHCVPALFFAGSGRSCLHFSCRVECLTRTEPLSFFGLGMRFDQPPCVEVRYAWDACHGKGSLLISGGVLVLFPSIVCLVQLFRSIVECLAFSLVQAPSLIYRMVPMGNHEWFPLCPIQVSHPMLAHLTSVPLPEFHHPFLSSPPLLQGRRPLWGWTVVFVVQWSTTCSTWWCLPFERTNQRTNTRVGTRSTSIWKEVERRRDEDKHGTCAQEEDPSHARTRRRWRNLRRRRWTRTRNATAHVDSTKQHAFCHARKWKRIHHQNGRGACANDRGRTYTKKKRNGTDAIGRTQPTTHET